MAVVIQNTWTEPDDAELRNFFDERKLQVKNLSPAEILKLSLAAIDVLFADTTVVQQLLLDRCTRVYKVPPTYPAFFDKFYHRKIERESISEALLRTGSFFVKPAAQSKCFDGFVVKTKFDRQHLLTVASSLAEQVYCCELVQFVSEFRLFIANHRMAGMTDCSKFVIADYEQVRTVQLNNPPLQSFVNQLLAALPRTKSWAFCVVDVGQLSSSEWAVVEVNPPFALSCYDFPIDKYYSFCRAAWQHISTSFL